MSEFYPTREVNTNFWRKSIEMGLSFEEKLLYLYALTNSHSCRPYFVNDVGYVIIYKFSVYFASKETGLSKETIIKTLKRMTEEGGCISFDESTSQIEVHPM